MAKTFKYKQSQKFRVIVKGVSVYTTAKQIRWQFGDQLSTNAAVAASLRELERMNASMKGAVGLCGTWCDMSVQIDEM
jgi:hypothetical protein